MGRSRTDCGTDINQRRAPQALCALAGKRLWLPTVDCCLAASLTYYCPPPECWCVSACCDQVFAPLFHSSRSMALSPFVSIWLRTGFIGSGSSASVTFASQFLSRRLKTVIGSVPATCTGAGATFASAATVTGTAAVAPGDCRGVGDSFSSPGAG